LFDVVVRIRRLLTSGTRSAIKEVRSEIDDEEDTGRERVDGRLSPGNEVRRTLIICGAMTVNEMCESVVRVFGCYLEAELEMR